RLTRHLDARPGSVELPPVIGAAQSARLVATEKERGSAMRTTLREQAHLPSGVAERDQILAEEAHAHRWPVGLAEVRRRQKRHPVLTQQSPHDRRRSDPAEQLVAAC